MRFSVLLPTRNRLELLRYALESVFRQDFDDWEIIVSDNASEQDVCGYVKGIGDPRVKYLRTDRLLPVTENWNLALGKSSGEYVVMLGDDDILLKGYFATAQGLIDRYGSPDLLYHKALLYAYPGVVPDYPDGFLWENARAAFFEGAKEPFFLPPERARHAVEQSMNFRVTFDYNMQHSLIRRGFIESLKDKGDFFQSPYPDYYASNAMFLKADRILVVPSPLVAIGISPKSFGYFYFNQREGEGVDFLHNMPDPSVVRELEGRILPGTAMNTFWLLAMETLRRNFATAPSLRVNYRRYRFVQMLHGYLGRYLTRKVPESEFLAMKRMLTRWERWGPGAALWIAANAMRRFGKLQKSRWVQAIASRIISHPGDRPVQLDGNYRNILEVFDCADSSRRTG
jgi:glycosyltransferase involved in cell wall biosynthesis